MIKALLLMLFGAVLGGFIASVWITISMAFAWMGEDMFTAPRWYTEWKEARFNRKNPLRTWRYEDGVLEAGENVAP